MTNEPRSNVLFDSLIGGFIFVGYVIVIHPLIMADTVPAMLLPVAILRGDGPFLDRFADALPVPPLEGERLPYIVVESRGHLVSRYPLGPAILALPFYTPQVLCLDRLRPGWDRKKSELIPFCYWMSKLSAAAITALTGVALLRVLRGLGLGRVALATTLTAMFGTSLWTIESQGLWQHGPASLALLLSLLFLIPRPASRLRLLLAGAAVAGLVAVRLTDVFFAIAITLFVVRYQKSGLPYFLVFPILIATSLIAYNVYYFGTVEGGQHQLEQLHGVMHNLDGAWSGDPIAGAVGTLFSPSRGLFIFTPWVALALLTLPATASELRRWPLICYALWSLIPYLLMLAKYSVWWGGHCFGPRYWTDAMPLFAILLAFGLDWAWRRSRLVLGIFGMTIVYSIAIQAVGIVRYDGSWDAKPNDVDRHHQRLWDWRDSVLMRSLRSH